METWASTSVADCLVPVPVAGKSKVQSRDYKAAGRFPIIDQGQEQIAGWTDDENAVIDAPLPLVVFGDHTRVFKFVDTPFARGADGTQLLRPKPEIDPLFFFYACRSIDLPARGYNRHFTVLKEKELFYPTDGNEQKAIAGVLRQTESALQKQFELLKTLQELKRAAMRELFTRGLRGEPQKETEIGPVPESWVEVAFSDLGEIVTGTTPPTKERTYYDDGTIPFISPGDIDHGFPIASTQKHITEPGLAVSRALPAGTTCVVCIGSTIGKVGRTTAPASATNQQINAIIPGAGYDQNYVSHLLTYRSDIVRNSASPSPVPILSKGAFEKLVLFTSRDFDEQAQIATILDALDRKIALHRKKRAVLEELFQSLLHKLMTGEIRVADLDLSALDPHRAPHVVA
ncbi:restriction modification system DNA specificity subunit [Ectothiorhodospira sp. PHS-1]|uniref:restriction endonuclease subunit S n=1 Tax=Ectothiorhodospira sp. PHS-1 TaxID=519989 RepID=UPI00024A8438|nr:restriction endonuclease subunit S [Ectothiorhodospira sp. PHS-1]EHQ52219.1 restriction modification system DNA specificity subunit [Ectothiorhodospira sp. PHS-1]